MGKSLYYVKEGAVLRCSLGTKSSLLKVPKGHGACIQGKNQASTADSVGGVNIMPFCQCSRKQPAVDCTPQTVVKWLNGKEDFLLEGEPALLSSGLASCIHGGVIRIEQSGQEG